jgi:hypothetical protein
MINRMMNLKTVLYYAICKKRNSPVSEESLIYGWVSKYGK